MEISAGLVIGRRTAQAGNTEVRLLQVMITDERDVQTVQLIGQSGEENNPPDGSQVAVLALGESLKVAVASTDTIAPVMTPGGKRLYSSTEGEVMAEIRLEPTGEVKVSNGAASFTMSPEGVFTFDGQGVMFNCDVAVDGALAATGDVTAGTVSLELHTHPGVTSGPASTGVPTP